ncbi:MAG: hypothetical protein Q9166_003091 [cf. Caloplaca sp. 2 TL-2023]
MKSLLRPSPNLRAKAFGISSSFLSRYLQHSSRSRVSPLAGATSFQDAPIRQSEAESPRSPVTSTPPPLSLLALPTLIRSYLISAISASPILLNPSLRILSLLAHSKYPFLQVEHNRFLHYVLKKTIYAQFCAGETPSEVRRTAAELRNIGYQGVVLNYAKEIVVDKGESIDHPRSDEAEDVATWKQATLKTMKLINHGDYAALKFSGAGQSVLKQLVEKSPPSAAIDQAVKEICERAKATGVRLLFDAEQNVVQPGIDQWTLDLQRKYNRDGVAVIYGTYQAYAISTPSILAQHLAKAQQEGFTLGVKLVRGAYMATDPQHLFWATKAETDRVHDRIAEALMRRQWNEVLGPAEGNKGQRSAFPNVNLLLATHNQESVRKAMAIRREQLQSGDKTIELGYAQLMGMADDLGCSLIMAGHNSQEKTEIPKTFKYIAWGTVRECLKYLLRRAEENRDALARTRESRIALGGELRRRLLLRA